MTLALTFKHWLHHNQTSAPQESAKQAAAALAELQELITNTYSDELWKATKAALAVTGSLSLKGRSHPLVMILEGPSGKGKSTVINMLNADREATANIIHRVDKFTSASFVSQAARISSTQLANVDLLPKLKNKVLLTKELAPLFRGREDELRQNFATLTTVLDGKGYITASGVHGERGTNDSIVFNWLGATTPIPTRTDAIMAQLGNRLVRYEIIGEDTPDDELLEFLEGYEESITEDRTRQLANTFMEHHFSAFPVNSVDSHVIDLPHHHGLELVRYSKLVSEGRVEVEQVTVERQTEYVRGDTEGPARVALLLQTYARGYALISGKLAVDEEAMESVAHIALSCIPRNRRKILKLVIENAGEIDSTSASRLLNSTLPTVRNYMKELAATGIVTHTEGRSNTPDSVTLADRWLWLLPQRAVAVAAESQV